MTMLFMRLEDNGFGLRRWVANDNNGFIKLEPELTVGHVETTRNQLDQAINQTDLGDGFPCIRRMLAGAEAVVDKVAYPDIASGYRDSGCHAASTPDANDFAMILMGSCTLPRRCVLSSNSGLSSLPQSGQLYSGGCRSRSIIQA
jgi:hypothetical protein